LSLSNGLLLSAASSKPAFAREYVEEEEEEDTVEFWDQDLENEVRVDRDSLSRPTI